MTIFTLFFVRGLLRVILVDMRPRFDTFNRMPLSSRLTCGIGGVVGTLVGISVGGSDGKSVSGSGVLMST